MVAAIKEEVETLQKLRAWELMILPKNKKAVRTKWAYDNKKDGNGKVIRAKAQLAAQKNLQVAEEDFFDVFAPVS